MCDIKPRHVNFYIRRSTLNLKLWPENCECKWVLRLNPTPLLIIAKRRPCWRPTSHGPATWPRTGSIRPGNSTATSSWPPVLLFNSCLPAEVSSSYPKSYYCDRPHRNQWYTFQKHNMSIMFKRICMLRPAASRLISSASDQYANKGNTTSTKLR